MDSGLSKRIQELAVELSQPRTQPGYVGAGTRLRAGAINCELIAMFNTELDRHTTTEFQRYKKDKNGEFVTDKNGAKILEPDPDREPITWGIPNAKGEILKSMSLHLVRAALGSSLSATDREAAILKAATVLPESCERLQKLESKPVQPQAEELQLQKKVLPDYPGFNEAVNMLRALPKTKGHQARICREVSNDDKKAAATLRTYLQSHRELWHEEFR